MCAVVAHYDWVGLHRAGARPCPYTEHVVTRWGDATTTIAIVARYDRVGLHRAGARPGKTTTRGAPCRGTFRALRLPGRGTPTITFRNRIDIVSSSPVTT